MYFRKVIHLAAAIAALGLAAPAAAQSVQFAQQTAYSRLDKLSARVEAVRYENVASNRPFVIVYLMIRNESNAPVLLTASSFEGTTLTNGSSVFSGVTHSFPVGFGIGEEGRLETKTLASYSTYRIAFRYQLIGAAPTAPLRLSLREKPLLKVLGKPAGGGQASFSVDGYAGSPAATTPLTTPPYAPAEPDGYQTTRIPDVSFRPLGPLRARVDGVRYASSAGHPNGPETIEIGATVQNTLPVALILKSSALGSIVVEEGGRSSRNASNGIFKNAARYESYTLPPGEWVFVRYFHFFPDQARLRAARRLTLIFESSEHPGGSFTIDIPRFTALTESQPAASKQTQPAAPATAASGDFQKTAYMDVKADSVTARKTGGVDVTVTVRNKLGRRLGMQHDWQDYWVVGSDGVEYRTDGNHYGTSGSDVLRTTVWVENDGEAKRTHVFPRLPFGVTATRLIIREYGKEKARIELPR